MWRVVASSIALLAAWRPLVVGAQSTASCAAATPSSSPGAAALWVELYDANPSQSCPAGWHSDPSVGDTCYWASTADLSFSDAGADCAARGGALAHVVDSTQQTFLAQRLSGTSGGSWLGLRDDGLSCGTETSAAQGCSSSLDVSRAFAWTDGRRSAYSRWNQPDTRYNGGQILVVTALAVPSAGGGLCAMMCTTTDASFCPGGAVGNWAVTDCADAHFYVCQKPSGRPRAYAAWTNSQGSGDTAGDDGWIDIALPFAFPFFGEAFGAGDLLRVSANGYITFGVGSSHHLYGSTSSLPSPASPNAVLAAFWTDLYPAGATPGGGLFSLAAGQKLVIEWRQIPYWIPNREQGYCSDPANAAVCGRSATFETILNSDGSVQFVYLACDPLPAPTAGFPDHAPLAIGFENMDGSVGFEIVGALARSYAMDMTGKVVEIPQSCHASLPYCVERLANASAQCLAPVSASATPGGGGSGSDGAGWVQVSNEGGQTYYHVSWHVGPTFALVMSFLVSGWRLYKVVTRGHIWRGHWISVENDLATVQAMLAAARAGGRGMEPPRPYRLTDDEMDSLVRLTSSQLREPVASVSPPADSASAAVEIESGSASPAAAVGANSLPSPEHRGEEAAPLSLAHPVADAMMPNFGNDTCAICMCSMLDEDDPAFDPAFDGSSSQLALGDADAAASLMQLTCSHVFHADCVGPWLQRHRECPICKRDAVHGDGSADREAAAAALFVSPDLEGGGERGDIVQQHAARQAIGALAGYQSCNRSSVIICLACVTGLVVTTSSEISYVQHCGVHADDLLDLRCGFFVAISLVSFAMATVAVGALHTPVRGRCLWDGFSGWCLYSFVVVSVCSSWYDKVAATHDSAYGYDDDCRDGVCGTYTTGLTNEQRAVAQKVEVLSVMLRCGAALVAVVQLTTARERELSIQWFLDIRAIVFQATARALGLPVHPGSDGNDGGGGGDGNGGAQVIHRGETMPGAVAVGLVAGQQQQGQGQQANALLAPGDAAGGNRGDEAP